MHKKLLYVLSFLLVTHSLFAQVSLTGTTSYTQNFNSLPNTGTSATWANNTTLPGWYAAVTNASNVTNPPATILIGIGNSTSGGFYDFGPSSNTDRALGSVGSGAAKAIYYGVLLTNNTGSPIKALSVNYKGEQWRSSTSVQNTLTFAYKVGATTIDEAGYTNNSSLNFVGAAPVTSNGPLDGNANATSISGVIVTNIAVGQSIMLRWMDVDDAGSDAGLSVDDLTVSVVTTPFLTVNPTSITGLGYTETSTSSLTATFNVGGINLTPSTPVTIVPPANFEISTDNATFSSSPLSVNPAGDGTLNQTIYTRLVTGLSAAPYSGTVTVSSPEIAAASTVALNATVYPAGPVGPCGTSTVISAIRPAAEGVTFTATGRVTSIVTTNIYIQDATGGILLYTGTGTTIEIPELSVGDEIQVTGVLSTYNTDKELKNFTGCFVKTGTTNVSPTSLTVTTATLCNHKGELVTLPGVNVPAGGTFAGGTNYNLSDGTQLRIQAGTDLVGATRPTTTTDITGVVGVFNNVCQLLPRSLADVPGATANTASCPEVGTGGSGISADNTLDITWWNIEWFGNTGFGPTNEAQQQTNVGLQLQALNQDIYCLEEVCDIPKLDAQIALLNAATGKTYARTCGEVPGRTPPVYYSHWFDDPEVPGDATTYGQKVCFVYNTAIVTNVTASQILADGNTGSSSWASNRFPLLMSADVTLNGVTKNIKLVGLHAKSGSDNSSYSRRIADFTGLKSYLDATYPADNVLIMGDYNDDADQSIYVDAATSATVVSSFQNFVNSPDYTVITKQLSNCNISSTASYPDIIDHLTVSNEISTNGSVPTSGISYIPNSVKVNRPIIGGTTTSDHFPVTARFQFYNPLPVNFISFTGQAKEKAISLNWVTAWEDKNEGFDVLKGDNAAGFEKVGYVAGHATTTNQSVYEFSDSDVKEGQLYYYRLKQKDVDGTATLSKIIAVRAGASADAMVPVVYPNPNPGSFTLSAKNLDVASIKLYNALGAEVPVSTSKDQGAGSFVIQATNPLPAGLYYLRIQAVDGTYKQSVNVLVR
ncbi:DUF5689 domain-containing protein [Spirosoma jeollabukense]